MSFKGRVWLIKDEDEKLFSDIDTDMIYHNAHLAITDIEQMGQYSFGNLKGWESFAKEAKPGDIVIAGENFGSGSSRQQAVDCFEALGISCLICESYGAIYKRNAINSGFPILVLDELNNVEHHDEIEVDMENGAIRKGGQDVGRISKPSNVQMDIYHAGNIFKYAKTL
jgi:3-isopropylmalate/(R)-2-methylmalate dehydratase small subunit